MAKLGEMLMAEGLLTEEQLKSALRIQQRDGGPLGQILIQRGVLSEDQLVGILARQTGYPRFDQDPRQVDRELAKVVPVEQAARHACAPLMLNGNMLSVGFLEPEGSTAAEALAQWTGKTVKALVIGLKPLQAVWMRLYGNPDLLGVRGGAARQGDPEPKRSGAGDAGRRTEGQGKYQLSPEEAEAYIAQALAQIPEEQISRTESVPPLAVVPGEAPVVNLVNTLLMTALRRRASDIHIEPFPEFVKVRLRIDGKLHQIQQLPSKVFSGLASRLKIMASLDIAERRFPQDGRIKLGLEGGKEIDFRVSTLPGIYGEKIVMRVLGTGQLKDSASDLGFRGRAQQYVRDALQNLFGMILVTGPTGSGKTTTLYTMLKQLSQPDVNIITAEDPVEYNLPDITQVSVRPQIGFTFDVALRAFLRQDPDIILVGEMRDYETAAIAVKAALTGHLVFSTLHTNDAPSTVVRLVDMGIEPYLVSSAVKLVVAQRLIRRLCEGCKEEVELSTAEQENLNESTLAGIERSFRGAGCAQCDQSGYKGRVPVFEVLPIRSRELKRVITEGGTEVLVAQVARREGLRSLKDEAMDYVNEGVTSLSEAMQIIVSE